MVVETTFPRGGFKPSLHSDEAPEIKKDFDLFGGDRNKIKQKNEKQKTNTSETSFISSEITAATADLLSYRTIQEGMVIFGCVHQIQNMTLNLQLPGRLIGRVMITHISTPYNQLLQSIANDTDAQGYKTLHQLFYPGQCVPTKVIKIDGSEEKHKLELSLLPDDINAQLAHTSLITGMTLWGAISSCEEHGYVVDLGIPKCRAFLQKAKIDEGKEYAVGELLWVVVQKCEGTSTASIISLNAVSDRITNTMIIREMSLDHIRPGMQVEFCINKILSNGIEGTLLNKLTGYIHEGHLPGVMDRLQNYSVDKVVIARVLYVMPITKLVYLTMRSLEPYDRKTFHDGAITSCKIMSTTKGGLYLQLNKQNKGFVSFRRLKTILQYTEEEEVSTIIKNTYRNGSSHQCRVLSFDYFGRVFICSLEKELLKPTVFCLKDLKLGETVSGTIKAIQNNGIVIQIERVTGFIINDHLSDMVKQSQAKLKSKFSVGQSIQSKVWVVNEEKNVLYLTMKPTLMSTEKNLTTYEEAVANKQFPGVIVQITSKGLLIQFFGDVHGWLPITQINHERIEELTEMFHIGEIVRCKVLKCNLDTKKLILTLQPCKILKPALGKHVRAIVTNVSETGVEVIIDGTNTAALIPLLHLTKFTSLALLIAETFNIGDIIPDLVCVSNRGTPILSLRDLKLKSSNIPNFNDLKVGQLLSCSVQIVTDEYMLLQSPIVGFRDYIKIPSESILSYGDLKTIDIKQYQPIIAQLSKIEQESDRHLDGSTKLLDIWNNDMNLSVKLLSEYLKEIQQIKNNFRALDNQLGNLNLGEVVNGIIQDEIDPGSYIIQLDNGAIGYANTAHCTRVFKMGEKVTGVVLWLNFVNEYAEISLIPKHMELINEKQHEKINIINNVHAEVLLVKEDFVLLVLDGDVGNKQFVFLPLKFHINDLVPNPSYYIDSMGKQIKIKIKRIENGFILGVPKEPVTNIIHHGQKKISDTPAADSTPKKKKRRLDAGDFDIDTTVKSIKKTKRTINSDETEAIVEANVITKRKKKDATVVNDTELEDLTEQINKKKNKRNKKKNATVVNDTELEDITDEINKKKNKRDKKKIATVVNDTKLEDITDEINIKKNKKRKSKTQIEEMSAKNQKLEHLEDHKQKHIESISTGVSTLWTVTEQEVVQQESSEDKEEINKLSKQQKKTELTSVDHKQKHIEPVLSEASNLLTVPEQEVVQQVSSEDEEKQNKLNKQQQKTELTPADHKQAHIVPVLSGANNFWIVPQQEVVQEESSEDEEEENKLSKQQKRKKLTPAERADAARIEEERIRKIETELADLNTVPKTADQFDRLVMANPNNSEHWINYMAFHLEATEIEKAKSVARRALTTIAFREEQEKLNIWIAFLNLENRYGTKESFTAVLEEATQMNDSLVVYLQALNILSDSKKTTEFTELLQRVSRKFKQSFKMWTEAAEACYKCDLKEQARKLMQRALQSLDEKQHVNVLVQFAFMESRFKDPERAEALLEKVLASYPRRVDVWTSYVDMLIKGNRIHIARNVLQRAIGQKLPARKMKTIYTKYIRFETEYGDNDSVAKVRKQAAAYVKTALQ